MSLRSMSQNCTQLVGAAEPEPEPELELEPEPAAGAELWNRTHRKTVKHTYDRNASRLRTDW